MDKEAFIAMICHTSTAGIMKNYKYVVVLSFCNGKILLSRKRNQSTWETQGGHIELGESPLEAAKRELYEESGALEYDIEPVCDYWAEDAEGFSIGYGMAFRSEIYNIGPIPDSEMEEVGLFSELPKELSYPDITPVLFERVK